MIHSKLIIGMILIVILLGLTACSAPDSPSDVVENYLVAMVAKDDILTVNLSCIAWEENAKAEGAGFQGVEVSLENAACIVVDENGDRAIVSCSGKFVFQYAGGEVDEIDLSRRNYSVVKEAGEWKMCGQPSIELEANQVESASSSTTPTEQPSPASPSMPPTTEQIAEMPAATKTPGPMDLNAYPVVPVVSARAIEIYNRGIAMGNDPNKFSKVGDCQNISIFFLAMFEKDSRFYALGDEYQYLQETIDWYRGSLSRESLAVGGGLNVARVLSPFHADVEKCEPNESSLQCEIRVFNPSIAIVSLEENWGGKTAEAYEGFLRTIIDYLISEGVLPILATKGDNFEGDHSINFTIIKLANEYELPLWNFWLAIQPLPNQGLRSEFYLTYDTPHFDNPENMEAAWPWRNLTALQTLDAVRKAVSP